MLSNQSGMKKKRVRKIINWCHDNIPDELCMGGWIVEYEIRDRHKIKNVDASVENLDPYHKHALVVVYRKNIISKQHLVRAIVHEYVHIILSSTVEFADVMKGITEERFHDFIDTQEENLSEKLAHAVLFAMRYGMGKKLRRYFNG